MRRLNYDEVKKFVEDAGYKLISKSYQNNMEHIIVQCPKGHPPYPVLFSNFYSGSRCPICANEKRKKIRHRWTRERLESLVKDAGYTLNFVKTDPKYSNKYLNVTCPNHHTYTVYLSNFIRGCRCGLCGGSGTTKYPAKDIAYYYLFHSRQETGNKYGVDNNIISRIFRSVYGCSKRQYMDTHNVVKKRER